MELVSIGKIERNGAKMPQYRLVQHILFRYLRLQRIKRMRRNKLSHLRGIEFVGGMFQSMGLKLQVPAGDLRNIPENGPFIVVANHSFGFLAGLAMIRIFGHKHMGFKVLSNCVLDELGPVQDFFIYTNSSTRKMGVDELGLKSAQLHLASGCSLGVFAAGEVAAVQKPFGSAREKGWDPAVVRFIQKANVPVVPIYLSGLNNLQFNLFGTVRPNLRALSLPVGFFNKDGQSVNVRIGRPLGASEINSFTDLAKAGAFLRACVSALKEQPERMKAFRWGAKPQPIADAVPVQVIERELSALRATGGLLFSKSSYEIYLGQAGQIPFVLNEIGRLREQTYRQVGEGTNRNIDLDGYDKYYLHLFAYDFTAKRIVGAYRLGPGDEIMSQRPQKGFYVQSLFDMGKEMDTVLQQTLELGRSFVVLEYQQKPLPLFLLWQGILEFLKANGRYRYLMGPVSISNDYLGFSKDLIVSFISKYHFDDRLSQWVQPGRKYKMQAEKQDVDAVLAYCGSDLQKVDRFISGIEPNSMRIPVLLKQYIKQHARVLAFNVDPAFNDSLDVLVLQDIAVLPSETLDLLGSR